MRRNAMGVNLRQSILKSFGRYLALVLIIALGSALFIGLVMSKTDMVHTGSVFMEQQNMFDLRFVSTYGWEDEQIQKVRELPGITDAQGVFYQDLIASEATEEAESVFRFYTLQDDINRFALWGGRMPENPNECLADGFVYKDSILGSTVTISENNDEDTLEDVKVRTFTVVGYGGSPLYMDMNRGTTSVGNGVIDAFFFVLPEAFDTDYYTEIHLTLPQEHTVYTDAYNSWMDAEIDRLEPEAEKLAQERFVNVKADAEEEYQDGYQEYLDGLQEYEDGKIEYEQEIADAYQELKDAEEEIIRGTRELNDAEQLLLDTEAMLEDSSAQIEAGTKTLDAMKAGALSDIATYEPLQAEATQIVKDQQIRRLTLSQLSDKLQNETDETEKNNLQAQINAIQTQIENNVSAENTAKFNIQMYQTAIAIRDSVVPAGYKKLESSRKDILKGWEEVEQGWIDWRIGWEDLKEGQKDLEQGWIDYEEGKLEGAQELEDARIELLDAQAELKDAREDIDSMDEPEVFVLDRTSNPGYNSLDSTSNIVAGVSRILPVFFLLVASLVCITTMTRMVDEERTQIGTLKALGYSNLAIMSKYLIYAGSGAVIGCGLGLYIGSAFLPKIIWEAYKIMLYIQDELIICYNFWLCGIVTGVYTGIILFVTWYCCRKALEEQPAELIRPKAPDPGKQLLVEKLPFWHRVSFLNKVMIRNIFRYRQRLAMMLVGIGGCTALLVTGFGLGDSIMGVVDYQFENVTTYDMEVYFTDHQTPEQQAEFLEDVGADAEEVMFFHQGSIELTFGDVTKEIYLISGNEQLSHFLNLATDGEAIPLPGEGEMVLSVGVAEQLGIQVGDRVHLRNSDLQTLEPVVSGIYDNHVYNYCLVSPQTLKNSWGEEPEQQMAYVRLPQGTEPYTLGAEISGMDRVMNVSISEDVANTVGRMMEALNLIIWVVVISAGLLAAIVLYNLTNININERLREIATIKVLGFNAFETAAYVFKENLALTFAGGVFGLFLGKLMLMFVMSQVKIDMVWFKTLIEPVSYGLSFVLTILSAFVVNFVFYFKLDEINMAEALKSVE